MVYYVDATKLGKRGKPVKVPRFKMLGKFPAMKLRAAEKACDHFPIETAQKAEKARRAELQAVKDAGPTFAAMADEWLRRYVRRKGLRSETKTGEISRHLRKHVLPAFGDTPIKAITFAEVKALRDSVADNSGTAEADWMMRVVRGVFKWFRDEHKPVGWHYDDVVPKGKKHEGEERQRVLNVAEVRALWKATADLSPASAMFRTLLLTGARLAKVQELRWDAVRNGLWTFDTAPREKPNAGSLKLPELVLDTLRSQPRLADNPHVFVGVKGGFYQGVYDAKARLDERMAEHLGLAWRPADWQPRRKRDDGTWEEAGARHWTIHDLRRTARTYMERLGVKEDIGEVVLGHKRKKIVRTYAVDLGDDALFAELPDAVGTAKTAALKTLADWFSAHIVPPPSADNVVTMTRTAA